MRGPRQAVVALGAAVLAGLAFAAGMVVHARHANGAYGFPLDDAWIHLTFARTLREHGTFAYFPGGPATSGSTSPLYTLLLAAGFFVTSNEKVLSYVLGIAAQAGFLVSLGLWARARLGSLGAAAAVVLLVGLDGRIGLLSVSGMETSLFLAFVAAALLARATRRPVACAAALGGAIWTRPDGLILAAALGCDALLSVAWDRERPVRRRWPVAVAAFAAIAGAYVIFNLAVGGRVLPNTFAAKTVFYGVDSRRTFLTRDVAGLFGEGGWLVLAPFLAAGLAREAWAVARRRRGPLRPEAGFIVAHLLAYLVLLPYAHRFGRYLVPVLPAAAVLSVAAARDAMVWAGEWNRRLRPVLAGALVLAVAVPHAGAARDGVSSYRSFCDYHARRHERCGRWLAENTPEGAVIATHDIGAIAFYSRRRIVDVAGLVDPEVVPHLKRPGYTAYLAELFARRGVTHLAMLRNWLEVSNVEPVFTADPRPEILEVIPWIPGRTHLVPEAATALEQAAARRLVDGDAAGAVDLTARSLAIDPANARAHLVHGMSFAASQRFGEAEAAYRQALALDPDYPEARFALATILAATGRQDDARAILEALRREGRKLPRLEDLYRALPGR